MAAENRYTSLLVTASISIWFFIPAAVGQTLCGTTSLLANRTVNYITSPGYPNNYTGLMNCQWTITANSSSDLVVLNLLDFLLQSSYMCTSDNVAIYDGTTIFSPLILNFCDQPSNTQFVSTGPSITVKFHSDAPRNYKGFRLEYTSQEKSALCTNTTLEATETAQYITSPGYPYKYSNFMSCQWTITADYSSHVVALNFLDLFLEGSLSSCIYDNVTIYDGSSTSSPVIQTFCGQTSNTQFISTGSTVTVAFLSDGNNNYRGFKVRYTSQTKSAWCSNTSLVASTTAKYLTSPSYPYHYQNNLDCQWTIKSDFTSRVVVLNLLSFYLESLSSCTNDYVVIYDGNSASAPTIMTLCGQVLSGQFSSTNSYMTIAFHSDSSVNFQGFKLQYTSQDKSTVCSTNALTATGTAKYISSPGYPSSYSSNQNCEWHITADYSSQVIVLKLLDFELETSSSCTYDYVTIYDGPNSYSPRILSLCGTRTSTQYISSGSSLTVVFHSDLTNNFKGFQFQYTSQFQSAACPSVSLTATSSANYLSSPNYPGRYPSNIACQWHITADISSKVVALDLDEFSLEGSEYSCYSDYVKIYDGPSIYSSLIKTLCGSQYYLSYESTGSDITVVFHSDGTSSYNTGFRFSYKSQEKTPDYIPLNTGVIVAIVFGSITVPCLAVAFIILVRRRTTQRQLGNTQNRVPIQTGGPTLMPGMAYVTNAQQVPLYPYPGVQNPQGVAMGAPAYGPNYAPPVYSYAVPAGAVPAGAVPPGAVPAGAVPPGAVPSGQPPVFIDTK